MAISDFRRRLGYNQTELAELLGVLRSSVSQWETEQSVPKFESIRKMFELGATVEELFGVDCTKSCPKAAGPNQTTVKPITEQDVQRIFRQMQAQSLDQRKTA